MAKVLLVEDDNNLREIYEARLQAEGYDIVSARDGEEALVVAKSEIPDLVISDVMMPKISGFEMLDIMRNTEGLKTVKVIMLTALGQAEDQTRADSLGADRYLVKSQVTLEDIVNAAQSLLTDAGAIEAPAAEPVPAVAEPVAPVNPQPVAVAPAPALEPVTPPVAAPEPVTVAVEPIAPTSEPVAAQPEPVAATPVAEPETPVIPLATAPPETPEQAAPLQMPPTPASTIPDVPAEVVTPVSEPSADDDAAADDNDAAVTEPTQPTPAEPVAPPEPIQAPEPVAQLEPAVPTSTTQAGEVQTSAEEEAVINQQIADFVQNQPASPPSQVEPAVDPVAVVPESTQPETQPTPAEPVAPPEPVQAPEPTAVPDEPAATPSPQPTQQPQTTYEQEKALNDALTNLNGQDAQATPTIETAPQPTLPAAAPTSEPSGGAPSGQPDQAAEPTASPQEELKAPSHGKTIAPLEDTGTPKKSLDELLAEEAAKEGTPATGPVVVDANKPSPNRNDFDPNSIAL